MGGRTERPEFTDRVRVELAGGGREVGHRRPKSDRQNPDVRPSFGKGTVLSLNVVRLSLIVVNCDLEERKESGRGEPRSKERLRKMRIAARRIGVLSKPWNAFRKPRDLLEEGRRKCM